MSDFRYTWDESENRVLKASTFAMNHCNVPPLLLASLSYQTQPIPIRLDNVNYWHLPLYHDLLKLESPVERAQCFEEYMAAYFHLSRHTCSDGEPTPRPGVNYRRLLLGWLFDADNLQGAAWKSWVESRFGLKTLFHEVPLGLEAEPSQQRFRHQYCQAIYNTNELYAQLDLLYFYCQIELGIRFPSQTHLTLYRGCTTLPEYEIKACPVKLFNNLNSLTLDPESAIRFGSKIYQVHVPLYKIVCFDSLLPNVLQGEQEYMVLGGLYPVKRVRYF